MVTLWFGRKTSGYSRNTNWALLGPALQHKRTSAQLHKRTSRGFGLDAKPKSDHFDTFGFGCNTRYLLVWPQNQRGTISTHLDLDATPDHFNTFWFGRKTSGYSRNTNVSK